MSYYSTLLLSGGSVKTFASIGALQYLYDKNLICNVETLVGTSAGAILCYLLAIGYTPGEIMV